MPIPEETLLRDDAVVAIDLILPKVMVLKLQLPQSMARVKVARSGELFTC